MTTTTTLSRGLSLAAVALVVLTVALPAQEVELNPGYINGDVQVGSEVLSQVGIEAYSDTFTAETYIYPDATSASFSLTVQVEPGSSRVWSTYARVYMNGYQDSIWFPQADVTVVDGTPSTHNFVEANPCYVEGTITVTGGDLSYYTLYASQYVPPYGWSRTSRSGSNTYRFPVLPGTGYTLDPRVSLTTGTQLSVPSIDFDCAAGVTLVFDLEIEAPSSAITGSVEFSGPASVDYYYIRAGGPAYKTTYLYPPFGPLNDTTYELADLPDGTYYVTARAYLNNYDDSLWFPLSSFESAFSPANEPEVSGGSSPVVNIVEAQAFIEGEVTLSGTVDNSDLSWFQIGARHSDYYGYAYDRVDIGTGAYDLIVTPGEWATDTFQLSLYRSEDDPDGYLQESIYSYNYTAGANAVTLAAGETAYRDYALPMGSVTIGFSVAGGGVLSEPQIEATCYDYDESTLLGYYYLYSYSTGQIDVTNGQVTIVGLKGDCTVNAQATVGGSLTSFGQFEITIEPGVDQQIEIGGPSLTVDVESGLCVDADEITVTGVASDDVEVASVTVNGLAASLSSTGNASDPNEVAFSVTLSIAGRGAHEILTVATDTAGKTATDTRTIYNDDGLPSVTFTPADGATFPVTQTSVAVEGTVIDESDVSVTINGALVTPDAAGDFSGSVPVEYGTDGENFITVVASDDCGSTVVTHAVILIDNQPPVAVCQNVTVVTGPVCSADAGVNNGSSDPDDDPITLTPDPTAPYPLGTTEVTLTVDDGSASDVCTAVVTVVDETAPVISLNPGPATLECQLETYSEPGAEATDVCDSGVQVAVGGAVVDTSVVGSYQVTYDATDASGNAAIQASRTVTVVDTEPPVVTCPSVVPLTLDGSCGAQVPDLSSLVAMSDACSPASGLTYSQDLAPGLVVGPGNHTVTVTVTDAAGNAAQCQALLTAPLEFEGFLPPVGGADATGGAYGDPVRSFKLKSTIPVKFHAFCAGVPYLEGIHTLQAIHWSSEEVPEEPIDATPTDAATTGNQFRLTGEDWHYNLDVQGSGMSKGQWELRATLSDGTTHYVWIQVR